VKQTGWLKPNKDPKCWMAETETRKAGFGFSEIGWLKPNKDQKKLDSDFSETGGLKFRFQ
jgi:hypothetical protein